MLATRMLRNKFYLMQKSEAGRVYLAPDPVQKALCLEAVAVCRETSTCHYQEYAVRAEFGALAMPSIEDWEHRAPREPNIP